MGSVLSARRGGRLDHVLFGVAQVLLAMVAVWWFVVLTHATGREVELQTHLLDLHAENAALRLAGADLQVGPLPGDSIFQIVPLSLSPGAAPIPGTALGVEPTPQARLDHQRWEERRRVMVWGEGTLLLLLVAVCFGMLWRLVLTERQYRRDIEAFMARVTHEMKTPLAGLKALLQTLREGRVPEERRREIAEMGLRQAEREEHLIENLLTAHRIARGGAPVPLSSLDLSRMLPEFVAHRERTMGFGREKHELDCAEGLVVRANSGALSTVLENLADNAFKYGAKQLRIHAASDGNGRVRIQVTDDGEGFEANAGEALFSTWTRGEKATAGPHGTGLGLSIARSLAREMGGDLTARSAGPGTGATFTLTLAASAAEGSAA